MKTKSILKPNHQRRMSVTLDIPIPDNLKTTPHQVQAILGVFFLENPQIIRQAFKSATAVKLPSLPITTEKQRKNMTLALQALSDDDLEWMDDIISARKDKQYPQNFFDD
jgi:hypothetical protein